MGQSRFRSYRIGVVAALLFAGMLTGVGTPPAAGQVTAVNGSAFGYSLSVNLFGGTNNVRGPAPTVSLPAAGSSTPVTATLPSAVAEVSPATFFSSGQIEVSTQGTAAGGSVTSSARITNLNTSQAEALTASAVASTCTASGSGPATGSTTITGGTLLTDSGDDNGANSIPDHPAVTQALAGSPAPNTTIEGHVHFGNATDNFRFVFNEQIRGANGTLTVNAVHQYLLGPTAVGELILGQVVCGVTGSTQATTTTVSGATTTTAAGATTTTSVSYTHLTLPTICSV